VSFEDLFSYYAFNSYTAVRGIAGIQNYGARIRHQLDLENSLVEFVALCIDQSNVEERTQQVMIMGRIYALAEKVS
jgi:hypothetical protein